MREVRKFAERTPTLRVKEAKKKYFFVYEGEKTEHIYFAAISFLREDIGVNPLIELIPIFRSFSEIGWSNPSKIVNRLIDNIQEQRDGNIICETLLNRIIEYLQEINMLRKNKVLERDIWKTMENICREKFQKGLIDIVTDIEDMCRVISDELNTRYQAINIVGDISTIIKNSGLTYEEKFDQICVIVDRDKESFTQYHEVLKKCREMHFQFYVTNPCFEFWLLLHFDEVFNLDQDKLFENKKISSNKRFVEGELQRVWPQYKKKRYNAEEIVGKIDVAIKNAKCFCQDIDKLEDSLGSNIGMLIENLRSRE